MQSEEDEEDVKLFGSSISSNRKKRVRTTIKINSSITTSGYTDSLTLENFERRDSDERTQPLQIWVGRSAFTSISHQYPNEPTYAIINSFIHSFHFNYLFIYFMYFNFYLLPYLFIIFCLFDLFAYQLLNYLYSTRSVFATTSSCNLDIWSYERSEPISTMTWSPSGVSTIESEDSLTYCAFNPIERVIIAATSQSDRGILFYDLRSTTPIRKLILSVRRNFYWINLNILTINS